MLKIDDAFADFQYISHRILNANFTYPNKESTEEDIDIYVDYEIAHKVEEEDHYLGVVIFKVNLKLEEFEFLDLIIEGTFIGNKKAFKFETFEEMLKVNAVASLSHIARLQIMNLTTNVGLKQPIIIPMINIIKLNKQKM